DASQVHQCIADSANASATGMPNTHKAGRPDGTLASLDVDPERQFRCYARASVRMPLKRINTNAVQEHQYRFRRGQRPQANPTPHRASMPPPRENRRSPRARSMPRRSVSSMVRRYRYLLR
ncbi:hypothetical protein K523DRAFT_255404, partial [Schizophyllum commune Tattone D]